MKIIDYDLVCSSSLDDFNDSVKECIGYGWQPMGSCFVCDEVTNSTPSNRKVYYYQPMVKYETYLDVNITPSGSIKIVNMTDVNSKIETLEKENEQLKYKLDSNTVLIEAIQKENEILQSRIRELLKENFQESKKQQQLLHLVAECSRCMPKASKL